VISLAQVSCSGRSGELIEPRVISARAASLLTLCDYTREQKLIHDTA